MLPFCYFWLRFLRLFLPKNRNIHYFYSYNEYKKLFRFHCVIKSMILGQFHQKVLPSVICWCFSVIGNGASIGNVVILVAILVPNKKAR